MNASGGPNKTTPTPESVQAALDTLEPGDYEVMLEALGHFTREKQASVSFLQRKIGIGYGRAARLVDALEKGGYVGPSQGPNKPREVLVTEVPKSLKDAVAARSQAASAKPGDIPSIENMPSVFPQDPTIGDREIVHLTVLGDRYLDGEKRLAGDIENITVDTFKLTHIVRAKVRLNDGTTMEGDFLNGNELGNGIITDPSGKVTTVGLGLRDEGALVDEPLTPIPYDPKYTGPGTMKSFNRESVLVGVINKGFLSRGRSTNKDGSFVDIDMSEGNELNGKGRKKYSDGKVEKGEFNASIGLVNGKKILIDGTILEGSFDIDDNLLGKITYGAGTPTEVVVEGKLNQYRVLNGQGKITRKGVTLDTRIDGNIVEGNFELNSLDGRGKRTYHLGTPEEYTQDGTFKEGNFMEGTIVYKSGRKTIRKDGKDYTGEFDENLTGKGENYHEGVLSRGTFEKGVLWNGYKIDKNDAGETVTIIISEGKEKASEPIHPSRSSGELAGLISTPLAPEGIPRDEYTRLRGEVTSANNAMDQVHEADISIGVDLDSKALDILKNLKEGVVVHLGGYRKQIPIENFRRLLLMPVKVALEENFPTDSVYMDALYDAVLDRKDHWVYEATVYKKIGAPSSKTGLHPERLFIKFRARVEAERASNTPTPHTFTPPPMTTPNSGTNKLPGITDRKGNIWNGSFTRNADETFSGSGEVTSPTGMRGSGEFKDNAPVNATVTMPDGTTVHYKDGKLVKAPAISAPRLDAKGNEWTGVDDSFSGHGKVVYLDGTIEEGRFQNSILIEGQRTCGYVLLKGNIEAGTFREGDLCKGRITYPDGRYVDVDMYEGNCVDGKGKKIHGDGSVEEGEFKGSSLLKGKKTDSRGSQDGEFLLWELKKGRITYPDGSHVDVDMYEGNEYTGKGRKVWNDGMIQDGEFDVKKLIDGTITEANGAITKVVDGKIENLAPLPTPHTFTPPVVAPVPTTPAFTPKPYAPYVRIKGITENAEFGLVPPEKAAEAKRGIERVENLCMGLPIEDQRRIGELHIKFKDRTPPAPGGLKGLLAKKPTGVIPWRALDTNPGEGNTFVEIDPSRLPVDDSEITQYLIIAAKRYDNQLKAEMEVEDLRREVQVSLAYDDDGKINFFKSPDGIKKIKTAMKGMSEEEKDALSRSDLLILMVGQKKEYYIGSKYRIILSCDTPMSEDQIASYLRGELRRVEQEDAAGGAPSRKPTKKSVPEIFSRTRGKIAGVLAALAVVGGGAAVVHQINKKPVPIDTTPAPKAPEAPEAAEPPKVPEKAPEEATKAPEKGPAESGEVKKVDLSKIPVGGKVTFTSPEDGVKKGVLKKNSRGKYEPVDAFDFDGDDDGTVIRIQ